MPQNPRIIIDVANSGGEEAYSEARDIASTISKIYERDGELVNRKQQLINLMPTILETVSTINLIRYSMEEVKQIMDGKGGISEVISITLNTLFFLNRYKEELRLMALLTEINKALMVAGVLTV